MNEGLNENSLGWLVLGALGFCLPVIRAELVEDSDGSLGWGISNVLAGQWVWSMTGR